MVKVCSLTNYPDGSFSKYKEYFEKFNYELHIFQKWAIEGVILGNHVLVTAPTGSGKSLPAEFAIDFFHSKNKKTIYCSPIKALSNQKYYDFTHKYPHISFGLITGDIKTNPDADVLIMTTEILLNKLYQSKSNSKPLQSSVSFDMDIYTELACVVFDEIHMINDKDRGTVWENCIMLLPENIQMIGLSATLDDPEKFAYWLENKGEQPSNDPNKKQVYLVKKKDRAVPLTHYSFLTTTQAIFKTVKDKTVHQEVNALTNKFFVIQDAQGKFNEEHYSRVGKMLKVFETNKIRVKRSHTLNQVAKLLLEKDMLPALCYVFSRKQIEVCAKELTSPLLETDSKIPNIVKHECDKIIRKLPNFQEYLQLPEYNTLVSLLEKGIATHHSGMMPVLREIVELFFAKGYIKFLFCTETVAIGLNLPVKTTIFTDINKHDGDNFRTLLGHEFVQASGRAGRLGIDTVGNVIHLHNLFRDMTKTTYKEMLSGKPQILASKFKISYNLLLNLIDIGDCDLNKFVNKSMITCDIDNLLKGEYDNICRCEQELDKMRIANTYLRTPHPILEEFILLTKNKGTAVNKKRKEIEKRMGQITDDYKFIGSECVSYQKVLEKEKELLKYQDNYNNENSFLKTSIERVILLLTSENLIVFDNTLSKFVLTPQGTITSNIRELNCLVFTYLVTNKIITGFSSIDLITIFSCFTNITINDELKSINPNSKSHEVNDCLQLITTKSDEYQSKEASYQIVSGLDYNYHYDLVKYIEEWCNCESADECKILLNKLEREKGVYIGEFVKALLKINNISGEMEKIAELTEDLVFLSNLKKISCLTLKYVVTNQSLYV